MQHWVLYSLLSISSAMISFIESISRFRMRPRTASSSARESRLGRPFWPHLVRRPSVVLAESVPACSSDPLRPAVPRPGSRLIRPASALPTRTHAAQSGAASHWILSHGGDIAPSPTTTSPRDTFPSFRAPSVASARTGRPAQPTQS